MGGQQPVQLVDLVNYTEQWKRGKVKEELLLPLYEVWSEQFLPLEDLGCCQQACLDCKSGRMLCTVPIANDEEYNIDPCDEYHSYFGYLTQHPASCSPNTLRGENACTKRGSLFNEQ